MKRPLNGTFEDFLATVLGLIATGAGGWLMYVEVLPWHAASVMIIVGLWLALPRRMPLVSSGVATFIKELITGLPEIKQPEDDDAD